MTLRPLEIISARNRGSGDLPSWVVALRGREVLHKRKDDPPDRGGWFAAALSYARPVRRGVSRAEEKLTALQELAPDLSYIGERHEPLPDVEAEDDEKEWASMRVRLDGLYNGAALFATKYGLLGLCKGDLRNGDEVY
ncbi:hypothetical protein DL766_009483 [Monosporascus sp. MC13-8B]|uniref:Uncharacterized protein n=1 Tax=Monosporascus cannonballus TaxID=155416 RepID=A0ABY0GWK0_9PEZI|nr:hypothetical protein DL762_008559 [Monosporascus cannonballus]RYO80899.1 hypothetical protein DL763_008755 [Monosporascus cannonballus]RYP15131.1 hypothetical protein DL766_009483 [Monosporascus sp. MC13-8B]